MYSIQKQRRHPHERKSLVIKTYQKSKDKEENQPKNNKIQRNSFYLINNWASSNHQFKAFRKSQYKQKHRNSQMKVYHQKSSFQRKSINRFSKNDENTLFYYFIKNQGNNSERVSQILKLRGNWIKILTKNNQNQINFYWNSLNNLNSAAKNEFPLFGRISGSYQLTDKGRLHQNIVNYCAKNQISNQIFLPVTFCFTSKQLNSQIETNVQQFLQYFEYIESHTSLTNSWILKPTNLNRGRNIFLFNTLQKLFNLLYVGNNSQLDEHKIIQMKSKNSLNKFKNYKSTHELQSKNSQKFESKSFENIYSKLHFNKQNLRKMARVHSINRKIPNSTPNFDKQIQENRLKFAKNQTQNSIVKKTHQNFFRTRQKSTKLKTQVIQNSHFQLRQTKHLKNKNYKKVKSSKFSTVQKQNNQQDISYVNVNNIQQKLYKTIFNFVQGRSSYGQRQLKKEIIIQKYIQNPFLINGMKFDIRIWVLVDQDSNFYIFKSGYLRFSSEKYKLDERSIHSNFIHLTNHAVQKYSDKYQKDTNIVKMNYLKQYMSQHDMKNINKNYQQKYDQILQEMQRIIAISLQATLGKFSKQDHNKQKFNFNCEFQLFGYDFLLDRQLNVRLIQANCNPSITEDNIYLEQAVPRMLNDMFKLTIDKSFLPKNNPKQTFHMDGQSSQNMWKKLGKIGQINVKQIKNSFQ